MTPIQIEGWVVKIVDLLHTGRQIEDARVELRGNLADPKRSARRLAAHCNASLGEPVLWIIGLSEDATFAQAQPTDLSDWWSQVVSHFDGLAPALLWSGVIPIENHAVTALLFESSRAPYVIRTSASQAGVPELEVPWREGTRIRSARRQDLIRMLTGRPPRVEVEPLQAWIRPAPAGYLTAGERNKRRASWRVGFDLYVRPIGPTPIIFPLHRVKVSLNPPPSIHFVGERPSALARLDAPPLSRADQYFRLTIDCLTASIPLNLKY